MARSVGQYIRDTQASHAAQHNYRKRAALLAELAHEQAQAGLPLTARVTRYRADIALHAARAEYFDEDPR